MDNFTKINENIHRLTIPYKDIFTTVYTVQTDDGFLLFDAASYDEDVENYIIPFLERLGITQSMLKFIFISHNHTDHAGGLRELMKRFPETSIVSLCPTLQNQYKDYNVLCPKDYDTILNVLKVVSIPGHTSDATAVFDTRTKTLISGDALQLYGIYGSGKWGANICYPHEHLKALDKLRSMDIHLILTAHDYHPCGYKYLGKSEVAHSLDMCAAPLLQVKNLIIQNQHLNDSQICEIYNNSAHLPTLGAHVVTAVREMINTGSKI